MESESASGRASVFGEEVEWEELDAATNELFRNPWRAKVAPSSDGSTREGTLSDMESDISSETTSDADEQELRALVITEVEGEPVLIESNRETQAVNAVAVPLSDTDSTSVGCMSDFEE